MKKTFPFLVCLCFLFAVCGVRPERTGAECEISVSGAWALYPMMLRWAEEYRKINPSLQIDISAGGAGKGMADALAGIVDIGMVSREIYPAEIEKGAWFIAVAKDAVVPVMNRNNPFSEEIIESGINKDQFRDIWITGEIVYWEQLLGKTASNGNKIHVYTRSDACGAAKTWAAYMDGSQEDLKGTGIYSDPGLLLSVQKDAMGIGYNNINYVYDMKTGKPFNEIAIIPLDVNNNGSIEPSEEFYSLKTKIISAIKDGSFPSPPARDLYLVSQGRPEKKEVIEFMSWILTKGQNLTLETGYVPLDRNKIQQGLNKLKDK